MSWRVPAAGKLGASCRFNLFERRRDGAPTHLPCQAQTTTYCDCLLGQLQYVDIDNDGSNDFKFSVLLVGDPILQRDRVQFYVNSGIKRNLLNNQVDESPLLSKGDSVKKIHTGYTWWEISSIVLVEKIIENTGSRWEGLWKNANHQYLPVQIEKNNKLYHGWIELSSTTMRLTDAGSAQM